MWFRVSFCFFVFFEFRRDSMPVLTVVSNGHKCWSRICMSACQVQTSLVHVNPLYKNDDEFDLARMPSSCAFSEEELTLIINGAGSELPPSSSGAQSPLAPTLPPQPSVPAPPSAISRCSCLPPSRSFTISFVPLDTPPFAEGLCGTHGRSLI